MAGYNRGDTYEQTVFNILNSQKLIAPDSKRGGAGHQTDIKFLHCGSEQGLEVKLDLKADYGQRMLKWEQGVWSWRVDDSVTQLYTDLGILNSINQKLITPYRYTVLPFENIRLEHKKADQKSFESSHQIDIEALYQFYKKRNCHYIQIGGYGFYHLDRDILNLGTSQFQCQMKLRLRAKTIHSNPIYNYGFYAVLKTTGRPKKSEFDIEEKEGRLFPPIHP